MADQVWLVATAVPGVIVAPDDLRHLSLGGVHGGDTARRSDARDTRTLATLALEAFGGSERGLTMPLFVCLAAIWATAVLVIVLIRLTI